MLRHLNKFAAISMEKHLKFNGSFLQDFYQLFKPYWSSPEKWSALALLALTVFFAIVQVRASIALNNFIKEFYDALQGFDKSALTACLINFAIIVPIILFSFGYAFYFNGLLSVRWRRWLTKEYLGQWLRNHTHYQMQITKETIDNPDQRISEDLDIFPDTTLAVFFLVLNSLLTLSAFSVVLWNLTKEFSLSLESWHFTIPGYLIWSALLFGIVGALVTILIGKKLAHYDYQQQLCNANFRFSLVQLREASEQIAFTRSEPAENKLLINRFNPIFDNFINIISIRTRLLFFSSGYNAVAYFIGLFLATPLYMHKQVTFGSLMQISGAFASVIGAFIILVNGYAVFANWRAVVARLIEFNRAMNTCNSQTSGIRLYESLESHIIVDHLTLTLPNQKALLENINLSLAPSDRLLLTGPSGCGKSTLLRALAGLWPHGHGQIVFPSNKKSLFLPQRPYMPNASLYEIVTFPHEQNSLIEEKLLHEQFKHCGLQKLLPFLHQSKQWVNELSLGEQQQLAFVKIFIQKPDILFLDEASSALDESMEAHLYEGLSQSVPDTTIISSGHRSSLHQFYDTILNLNAYQPNAEITLAAIA